MRTLVFEGVSVLVIGDVMLDRYYVGDVTRISPEAPVPVVLVRRTTDGLGGAANVANNIAHLGAKVILIGLAGEDENRRRLEELVARFGIEALFIPSKKITTVKSRIIGGHQQMLRLDFEEPTIPSKAQLAALKEAIAKNLPRANAVIMSDYGKGVCCPELCRWLIRVAARHGIPTVVDPKSEDWRHYHGAVCVTPNLSELCKAVGRTVPNEDADVAFHARRLVARYRLGSVLVTRSEKGMSLVDARSALHIHSRAREVFDVSGAGDTVVATFTTALAAGFKLRRAVELANCAAGIVVGKLGTVPIKIEELRHEIKS